jgi:hypothetical protein
MAIYQINSFCSTLLAAHPHGTHGVPGSIPAQPIPSLHVTLAQRTQAGLAYSLDAPHSPVPALVLRC